MSTILNYPDFDAGARHQQKVRREKRDVRHALRGVPVNRAPVYLTLRCGVYAKVAIAEEELGVDLSYPNGLRRSAALRDMT